MGHILQDCNTVSIVGKLTYGMSEHILSCLSKKTEIDSNPQYAFRPVSFLILEGRRRAAFDLMTKAVVIRITNIMPHGLRSNRPLKHYGTGQPP